MTDRPDLDAGDPDGYDTLPPEEATDSDELRNDDGDATVTAPDSWQGDYSTLHESLDDKLAAEQPDVIRPPADPAAEVPEEGAGGRHRAQVSGTPEDGESFFTIEE
ncbi:hypothetical protein AWC02_06685 [Mycolicibacter engbaekii]|uniref:DUF5709 domain-containing protein n=1 Tax=Mycolicibacter engbaekii TaxID=188915 RepID=A0A1X1TXV9_9MYCO|nr:hypothetical protein [Mycolicibacter engbaekii]ORV49421.1 hypothetical protein AWC02_06685 [Mycolicibacter engbaekii]